MSRSTPRPGGTLRQISLLAANDLRLTLKDRASFLWMLLLPLGMMWLFGQMGSGGGTPTIDLGVENRDGGWLAQALIDELEDEQVALTLVEPGDAEGVAAPQDPVTTEDPATESPARPIRVLVIPEGFTDAILAGETRELRLEVDPEANKTFGMGAQVHAQRAIIRVLGRLLETELAVDAERLGDAAVVHYTALSEEPAKVTLDVSTAGRGRAVPSGYAQSVPGILTMTVLMMTLIYGGVFLVIEKRQGMFRRQATLPLSYGEIISGKLVGRVLIAGLQVLVLFVVARFAFGLDLGSSPVGLALLATAYTLAVAGLAVLLGAVLSTEEQASSLGWIGSMVMAGLGGCWWPGELMPDWLQAVGKLLPTTWAMEGFHALLSFGRGVEGVVVPVLALLGFATVFTLLAVRYLRVE